MSERFPGGYLTTTPPAPSSSAAPGVWTLDQALQNTKAGTWPPLPVFVEDVFSTYLYAGTGANLTITNGVNLTSNGGMVWLKGRDVVSDNTLADTVRGTGSYLYSNSLLAADTGVTTYITSFGSTGFSLGSGSGINQATKLFSSWTFRKAQRFFDVVTWTGDGTAGRQIPHSLGVEPGCIIVKSTTNSTIWAVYHRGLNGGVSPEQYYMSLTAAGIQQLGSGIWNNTAPTSSNFTIGSSGNVNGAGQTYVAYLWAHDPTPTGVVQCGFIPSATSTVTLGWEPQWVLWKASATGTGVDTNWIITDNLRGMPVPSGDTKWLYPNLSAVEATPGGAYVAPTATGFADNGASAANRIYIAIRRGPMRTPTTGTSVFSVSTSSANTGTITSGFPTDLAMEFDRTAGSSPYNRGFQDRLRGAFLTLSSASTVAQDFNTTTGSFESNTGLVLNGGSVYANGYVYPQFRRAPGFFDVVCYNGNNSDTTAYNHNLGVVPELIIAKTRTTSANWRVGTEFGATTRRSGLLNTTDNLVLAAYDPGGGNTLWTAAPTATTFTPGTTINQTGASYVAYLWASCPGVSKVGSFSGTGATLQIDCGFTGGARFILIKRIDSTGNWHLWDSARGIVASNDPYLLLNTTAPEVTTTDWVDTFSAGFELSSAVGNQVNIGGATYLYLAIA